MSSFPVGYSLMNKINMRCYRYCTHCKQTDHGSSFMMRKKNCPAFNKPCTRCHRVGHFSISCHKPRAKVDRLQQNQQEEYYPPNSYLQRQKPPLYVCRCFSFWWTSCFFIIFTNIFPFDFYLVTEIHCSTYFQVIAMLGEWKPL